MLHLWVEHSKQNNRTNFSKKLENVSTIELMLFPELSRTELDSMKASKSFFEGLYNRVIKKRETKVFVIGFHKTGTSSIGKALQILGYRVCGSIKKANIYDVNNDEWEKLLSIEAKVLISKYDAFQDTPWFLIYKLLSNEYPDSKFILTTRKVNTWIESVNKHFYGERNFAYHKKIYGVLSPESNQDIYCSIYERHNNEVRHYFKDKENFIELNIESDFNWGKLCVFLDMNIPKHAFPHANSSLSRGSLKRKR